MYIIRKIHNIDHLNASMYILYSKMLKNICNKERKQITCFNKKYCNK